MCVSCVRTTCTYVCVHAYLRTHVHVHGYKRAREKQGEGGRELGGGKSGQNVLPICHGLGRLLYREHILSTENTLYSGELLYVARVCKPLSVSLSLSLSQRLTGRTVFGYEEGGERLGGCRWKRGLWSVKMVNTYIEPQGVTHLNLRRGGIADKGGVLA